MMASPDVLSMGRRCILHSLLADSCRSHPGGYETDNPLSMTGVRRFQPRSKGECVCVCLPTADGLQRAVQRSTPAFYPESQPRSDRTAKATSLRHSLLHGQNQLV